MNIIALYDKLEKLVARLPEPLQSPILREVRPIKTLFLHQRAPRLLLLGDRAASRSELINALFGENVSELGEDHLQDGTWQLFTSPRGKLRILDARRPISAVTLRGALSVETPDVCLFLYAGRRSTAEVDEDLLRAREVLTTASGASAPAVLGVACGMSSDSSAHVRGELLESMERGEGNPFRGRMRGSFVLSVGKEEIHRLAAAIAAELPDEAKLEMARLSGVKEIQRDVASALTKSVAAICGAVGTQPIPLADFPILTTLQAAMVAGIMHISGREMSTRLAAEWIGALGANIGLGLVLREGSRAALKLLPVWGDLVSGGIAAAGTYAVGRAASAYFIDEVSLHDAKRVLREKKKTRPVG